MCPPPAPAGTALTSSDGGAYVFHQRETVGGCAMCFVHSESAVSGRTFIEQFSLGAAAAAAVSGVGSRLAAAGEGVAAQGVGRPDMVIVVAEAANPPAGGGRTIDGFSKVLHNRWNQDIPAVAKVREGEAVQFLCRDALDIGTAARTLRPDGVLTLDLGKVHPLTGPVEIEGAKPGDVLEVEIVDVAPLVDFGYVVIGPALGLFGGLRPDVLASFHQFTEASELSDPSPGKVPGAIPADQPFNSGAPFVQIFTFNKGQNTGFATFEGKDTGRKAKIPIAPFMGVYGVAPLRKGMYRTVPPNVSGGMGGNTDIKQFVKGSMIHWLARDQGLSLHEAYAICSVAGDLKISEVVDIPNWVVSMTVPRGIFD